MNPGEPKEKITEKKPETNPSEINPLELKDFSALRDRLGLLIKQISGRPDVKVVSEVSPMEAMQIQQLGQDPKKTWFQREYVDPKTGEKGMLVRIPEQILEAHEDIAKGKAAHEAGHVAITRFGRFVPDKVMQELGFHQLIAAAEERPTDQVVRDRYPGAGICVDTFRTTEAKRAMLVEKKQGKLGYLPKSIQFDNLLVYGRHFENLPDYDPEALEAYEKTKADMESLERALPEDGASEKKIEAAAKDRYRILYKKVWPESKKLVAKDIETEKLRKMLNEALKDKDEKEDNDRSEEQKALKEALDNLDEEFKKELESAIEEARREAGQSREESKETLEKEEAVKSAAKDGITPEGKPGGETEEDAPMKDEEDVPIAMDKLSQKLIEILKKIFDKLPQGLKELLHQEAIAELQRIEDEIVREFSGKIDGNRAETHLQYEERLEKENQGAKRRLEIEKIKEEMREIESREAAVSINKDEYEIRYQEIRNLDEKLYRELEEIFTPNIKRQTKLKSSGSKINLPAIFKWEASRGAGSKGSDNKVFETVHLPEKKDYVFTILNDLSGSMIFGGKIEQDFKAKILFAEVLNRLGVRYELLGFNRQVFNFKSFNEELTDIARKRLCGMIAEVRNDIRNADGLALLQASKNLEQVPGKEKFLIVISDGLPTISHKTDPERDLHDAVGHVLKNTNQKLIGLGLGGGTEHVSKFYPTSLPNIKVEELVERIGELLKDMIVNPEKYAYNKERQSA